MGQPSAAEETIGQRVKRLRLERKLSHRKPSEKAMRHLAVKLGVTTDYIETGRTVPASDERELRATDAELVLRLDGDLDATEATFGSLLDDPAAEPEIRARALAGLGLIKARSGDLRGATALLDEAIGT